jgi:hypothetical protein
MSILVICSIAAMVLLAAFAQRRPQVVVAELVRLGLQR